ncbi:TfoX domain-containing protein, partial [Myxococcota bacterium]|nr:TfoX domain-containing protein [Myxococcota bacterium]
KPTDAGRTLLGSPTEAQPYPGGRNHFLLQDELDDPPRLRQAFEVTAAALPLPKPKPARTPAVAAKRTSPAAHRSRPKPGG